MHTQRKRRTAGKKYSNIGHRNMPDIHTSAPKKGWIIIGSILCLLLLIYIAISVFFMSHFFMNTGINGHNFSGKTVSDAERYLKDQVNDYSLTIRGMDGKTDVIKGADISLVYVDNNQIENILKKQNPFLWPQSVFSKKAVSITIELSYNKDALDQAVGSIHAVTTVQTPPVSAQPEFDGTQFVIKPETYGTAVDMNVLKEKITSAIMKFSSEINLEKEKCYALPKYSSESKELKQACAEMNKYCKASITYPMNEAVVVDKMLISTWLTTDDNMNVIFHEDAVKNWLEEFGDKYDTIGTTRTFTTPSGKSATVTGGTYGWSVDEDTEFENLKSNIKNGETVTREPAYYIGGTAAAHAMPDWGDTFVDVDLSEQHMWYVVNGSIALETNVITGEPIPEKITPEGTYSLQDKKMHEILVGSIDPATGKPSYETEVTYWMRITWDTGIGLHDATWQSGFGGNLYQIPNIGSHGCINMPLDMAGSLYDMIEIGTPVIVHY